MTGRHKSTQTAFRYPEAVLVRLKASAERYGQTMTDIVVRGTIAELDRLDSITTVPAPDGPVSPPRRTRKLRADSAPAAKKETCPHRLPPGAWCKECGTAKGK